MFPYIVQINYSINNDFANKDIFGFINSNKNISFSKDFKEDLIVSDLINISSEFYNETFIIGNKPDDYQILAHNYWGNNIKEFVSIQDYILFINNQSDLYEKTFKIYPRIKERRQIWISGGISKNPNDLTDYKNIKYAISLDEPFELEGFKFIRKYNYLYLFEKNISI